MSSFDAVGLSIASIIGSQLRQKGADPLIKRMTLFAFALAAAMQAAPARAVEPPLRIGYSDWPGWVAWQVAIDKGWLQQAGINAEFQWFDYSASLDAYAAGKLDGVLVTNGDALVTSGNGARNVMMLVTDYSNGNDMIVARPGLRDLHALKGKKVGVEVGLVEHLLLLDGLKQAGMAESDVTLVNTKTNETPQVLASGEVAAIGAWQPNCGAAMRAVPGARPVFTSAQEPGLIYDGLAVTPASLARRRPDYEKLMKVWYRVVAYIDDPATQDDAVRIMAARVGVAPAVYKKLLGGTRLLPLADARRVLHEAPGFGSLYGSSQIADDFNVRNAVYKTHQDIHAAIDPSLTQQQR